MTGQTTSRVLMTADAVGGVWTYALELARQLGRQGVQVCLATMGGLPDEAQRRDAARIPTLQLFESSYKLEWMEDPWPDVAEAGKWLLELESAVRPDIVHLNGYSHAALPWTAPAVVVAHSCVLSWWIAVKEQPAPGGWDRYREEVRRGLCAADLVIAPTRAMLASIRDNYDAVLHGARVIPNGRNPRLFRPAPKQSVILSAGRLWDEAKNIGLLDRVAPRLPWPVCIAGQERHPAGHDAGFQGVRRLGRLAADELAAWYGRAAIYALPARYEPFGLSVLEAALAGCALVLGDIASLRENWTGAALFVPPDDADALERALQNLIANAALRRGLAALAHERARRFTPQRMTNAYLDAYRQAASNTRRQARCA